VTRKVFLFFHSILKVVFDQRQNQGDKMKSVSFLLILLVAPFLSGASQNVGQNRIGNLELLGYVGYVN